MGKSFTKLYGSTLLIISAIRGVDECQISRKKRYVTLGCKAYYVYVHYVIAAYVS